MDQLQNQIYNKPDLYDSLFADYSSDTVWLAEKIQEWFKHQESTAVLELACGTGRIIGGVENHLQSKPGTRQFTGIDINPLMLNCARGHFPRCNWELADMFMYNRKKFDCVVLMANSLAHFHHVQRRTELYKTIRKLLVSGGRGVVAVLLSNSFEDSQKSSVFVGECSDDAGNFYEVYEQSRPLSSQIQEVDWFFVNKNNGPDEFNRFHLNRFSAGDLTVELKFSGANIIETYTSFIKADEHWEICVFR